MKAKRERLTEGERRYLEHVRRGPLPKDTTAKLRLLRASNAQNPGRYPRGEVLSEWEAICRNATAK